MDDDHRMAHELFEKLQNAERLEQLLVDDSTIVDELSNDASFTSSANNTLAEKEDGDDTSLGWTLKDSTVLAKLLLEQLSLDSGKRVMWRDLTKKFNELTNEDRSKIQLYSHARHCFGSNWKPVLPEDSR